MFFATQMDVIDLRLLELLQGDASLTNQALAERAGVSPATALRRVKALQERGVIEAQVALLNPAALAPLLTALVEITLDRQGAEHLEAFERRAIGFDAVQQCYRTSPGPDFLLILQVTDMDAYANLAQQLFTQDANVRNVKTFFAVKRAKFRPQLPLPAPR